MPTKIMDLKQAIEQVDLWEGEDRSQNPTIGSEDDLNLEASVTSIAGYVVYSYYSQWLIQSVIWRASDFIESIEDVLHHKADSDSPAYMIWRGNRWSIPTV